MGREVNNAAPRPPSRRLWWTLLLCFAVHACAPSPQTEATEEAIRRHFQELGCQVVALSLGELRRNPPAERVYMAPLTYVVGVRSITLAAETRDGTVRRVTSTDVAIKVQLPRGAGQAWTVSRTEGVDLP